MRSLQVLLKRAEYQTHLLARELSHLRIKRDSLLSGMGIRAAKIETEGNSVGIDPVISTIFLAFVDQIKQQDTADKAEILALNKDIAKIGDKLNASYQQKARFDILITQQKNRALCECITREQSELDEIAAQRRAIDKG